jgi:hypothetical protein
MFDAMLRGWRAQQKSRGLRDETAGDRERLIRRPVGLTEGCGHCLDSPGWSALGRVGWLAWPLARLPEAGAECDGAGSVPGDAGPRLPG